MKAFQGGLKVAFLCFFISHIPITILIDSQAVSNRFHPWAYQFIVQWYSETFGDFLMSPDFDEPWFPFLIWGEILFQFPIYFISIRQLNKFGNGDASQSYPEWFRVTCIIYAAHAITNLVPILGTFLTSGDKMTTPQRCATVAVYSPYLIFPVLLMYYAVKEDFFPETTPQQQQVQTEKKEK